MANIQSKCLKIRFLRNQLTDNSALGAFILKFAKPKLLSNIIKIDALKFLEYYYTYFLGEWMHPRIWLVLELGHDFFISDLPLNYKGGKTNSHILYCRQT